jgi:hypothetical protein
LKNSSQGISPTKFVRKLLNVRSPQALKFTEITGLVPFSTARDITTVGGYRTSGVTHITDMTWTTGGAKYPKITARHALG